MWIDDLITLMNDAGMVLRGDLFVTARATVPRLPSGEATMQIIETDAGGPERTQNKVTAHDRVAIHPGYMHVGAQFTARADSSDAARAKCYDAYYAVVNVRNCWVVSTDHVFSGWYREINPLSEPFEVVGGPDDRGQARYTFTVHGIRRP